jgi:hypothetical protein
MSPVVAAAHRFVHPAPTSSWHHSAIASSPALSHAVTRNIGNSGDSSNHHQHGRAALFTNDSDESIERHDVADRDDATPVARPRHGSAASVSLASAARRAPNAVVHASHAHHTRDTAAKTAATAEVVADADADARLAADPSAIRSPSSAGAVTLSSSAMTPTGLRASSQRYASAAAVSITAAAASAAASTSIEAGDSADEPASPPMAVRFHTRPPPSYASMLRTAMAAAALESDDASYPHTHRSAFDDEPIGDFGEFDGDSARGRSEQAQGGVSQSFFLPTPANVANSPARLTLQRESAPMSSPSPLFAASTVTTESGATPARKILGRTFLPSRSTPASAVAARAVSVASTSAMDS